MMPLVRPRLAVAVIAALLSILGAAPADAHLLGSALDTAAAGFAHPFSGLDHILAMVAVGLWAAQQGRPAILMLPLAFPAVMALGGWLGATGMPLPFVESGIAASVLMLGAMIVAAARPPLAVGTGLVSLFALFHGHAHGAELPETASLLGYGLGFVAATLALHLVGLGLGLVLRRPAKVLTLRIAGSAIAVAGLVLLAD